MFILLNLFVIALAFVFVLAIAAAASPPPASHVSPSLFLDRQDRSQEAPQQAHDLPLVIAAGLQ